MKRTVFLDEKTVFLDEKTVFLRPIWYVLRWSHRQDICQTQSSGNSAIFKKEL